MIKLLLVLIVAINSVCFGAPIEERGTLECKAYGKPQGLMGVHGKEHKYFGLEEGGKHGTIKIVESKTGKDQFQFYHCKAPTKKYYDGPSADYEFGQVRSVEKKGYCLTSDNTWVSTPKNKYDVHNFTPYPGTKNGSLTLQPCAKEHGLTLRLQWFDVEKNEKACVRHLELAGAGEDEAANEIVEDAGRVYLRPAAINGGGKEYGLVFGDGSGRKECNKN